MRLLFIPLFLGGCPHPVSLTSDPAGAYVTIDGTPVGVTPFTFSTKRGRRVTVEMNGFRAVTLRGGPGAPAAIEVRLVPEHGGAGTWSPTDAQ